MISKKYCNLNFKFLLLMYRDDDQSKFKHMSDDLLDENTVR